MPLLPKSRRLKKELSLLSVYVIATGMTISSGFFLLPGLAFTEAGPSMILAYLIAAIPLIPAIVSKIELATAMPRAGGVYYFLDRALGPLFGTIIGIGVWIVEILKVAFALIGMGAYIKIFIPEFSIIPIAIILATALGVLNLFGAKTTGGFQAFLVLGLLTILTVFIGDGISSLNFSHFQGFFDTGFDSIMSTAGLVYISYIGITKVVSLSEEIKTPERNIPIGIFLALGTAFLIYTLGMIVMVGTVSPEILSDNLTPVASAAANLFGQIGVIMVSAAAILAFISVANAGILGASRYPLAMSRDHIMPAFLQRIEKHGTPFYSISFTTITIVATLLLLDPLKIALLASAFQLLIFSLVCLAVIVMRESQIDSYDPGYRSSFYPWTQIIGIFFPLFLIGEMGWLVSLFTFGLVAFGAGWYFYYARKKVSRKGAIIHLFARLGQSYNGPFKREKPTSLEEF